MRFFEKYVSGTTAGMGNQSFFFPERADKALTARVYIKPTYAGTLRYAFLFSNILDSTFSDGLFSARNNIVDEWHIIRARAGVCDKIGEDAAFTVLTFDGKEGKTVAPGEFFASDEISLTACKEQYICLELCFCGAQLPYHPETLLPCFRNIGGKWIQDVRMPLPGMVGCVRDVRARIGFWGDSITQGIGTPPDSYTHYAHVVSRNLGDEYAYHDLGLGFGRADDAASCGAWAFKAKQNDLVTVCFGVNDLLRGYSAEQITRNIDKIVSFLKGNGVKVILQTVPPFNYDEARTEMWKRVNAHIRGMADGVDAVLDVGTFLSADEEHPERARFGGHPNAEGNRVWGEALTKVIEKVLAP